MESLKGHGVSLKEKGVAFQADVAENLEFNNEQLSSAQGELTSSIIALSTTECAKYESYLYCDGVVKLQGETFDKDMATIGTELFQICHELEDTFDFNQEGRLESEIEEKAEEADNNDWSQSTSD